MRRISTATKVTDKFGAGKHGFTNGNAALGTAATDLEDQWFDHVQEELANVIEAAGIAVDGSVRTQLLSALRAAGLFQTQAVGDNTTKAATTAFVIAEIINQFTKSGQQSLAAGGYQKLPGGLILQWGAITKSGAGAFGSATFAVAFPSAAYGVILTDTALPANSSVVWATDTPTLTGFQAFFTPSGTAGTTTRMAYYLALGK